jgi:hypothetical protein
MTAFDSLKAAREQLAGLLDVQRTLARRERAAAAAVAEAGAELDAMRKIAGYVRISIAAIETRIAALEQER